MVEAHVLRDLSLVRVWREYLGLTRKTAAGRAGIQQSAPARLDLGEIKPRCGNLARFAESRGLGVNQLQA
jgi:predicted transcriptional regulator